MEFSGKSPKIDQAGEMDEDKFAEDLDHHVKVFGLYP